MVGFGKQKKNNKAKEQLKTFPVKLTKGEIKKNKKNDNNISKEKLIDKAINFHLKGNFIEAAKYYEYCIDKGFKDQRIYTNYPAILLQLGKIKEAININKKAIVIFPHLSILYYNLGDIYLQIGQNVKAEEFTRKAIYLNDRYAKAYLNLGIILKNDGKFEESKLSLFKAIEINPKLATSHYNLANIFSDLGQFNEAKLEYEIALKLEPNNLLYGIQSKLFLSPITTDLEHINNERNEYIKQISILAKSNNLIFNGIAPSTKMFYLAYHNRSDDIKILSLLGKTLSGITGIKNTSFNRNFQLIKSRNRSKIRLGICSDFFHEHSVSSFFGNIIKDIASSDIEVLLFTGPDAKEDENSKYIKSFCSEVIRLPRLINEASSLIISKSLDILFYLEIGMSDYTYLLSLLRLALVQVTNPGHPTSSGSPEIDYFITCDNYETKHSNKYYSERLIRLSRIPANFSFPAIRESDFNTGDLEIPDGSFLIGIPHTLFKFHPEFDLVLDEILKEIPNSVFLLFSDENYKLDQLKHRWEQKTKLIIKRTIIFPKVEFNDFLKIIKIMDIILDPFYFGMGNTFYQAMAFGIPVVTMPTNHAKARHAYAGYKQMLIDNPPIASSPNEYILICKKLASNKLYKENLASQILVNSREFLFDDSEIYKEYIYFFKAAIKAAYSDSFLPSDWRPTSKSNNE